MTSVYALSENDRHGSFLVESARHLRAQGVDLHVFAPSFEGLKSHVVQGVPVHRFRYFFRGWENLTHMQGAPNRIRNPLYLFVAAFYILFGLVDAVRFCRRHKFDLIHVHWPFPHGIWGCAASWVSGTPLVLTFHGAELRLMQKFPFVRYFLRGAIDASRGVICNSSFTAGEVAQISGRPVSIIPFGCTVDAKPSIKDRSKPVKDILFAGRLIARKGVDFLIRAMPEITRRMPAHLHIVSDGDMAGVWRELVREMGLESSITFHGIVSNEALERFYAEADVFVLPAIVDDRGDTEGLGVVLVEALTFGTPVVATNVGGIPDVIRHGQTGLLVPQRDSAALADAVVEILADPALADTLSEAGIRFAREYFDWERITGSVMDFYRLAIRRVAPAAPALAQHRATSP